MCLIFFRIGDFNFVAVSFYALFDNTLALFIIFIIAVRIMNRSSTSPFRGTAGSSTRAGGIESAEMLIRTL